MARGLAPRSRMRARDLAPPPRRRPSRRPVGVAPALALTKPRLGWARRARTSAKLVPAPPRRPGGERGGGGGRLRRLGRDGALGAAGDLAAAARVLADPVERAERQFLLARQWLARVDARRLADHVAVVGAQTWPTPPAACVNGIAV